MTCLFYSVGFWSPTFSTINVSWAWELEEEKKKRSIDFVSGLALTCYYLLELYGFSHVNWTLDDEVTLVC